MSSGKRHLGRFACAVLGMLLLSSALAEVIQSIESIQERARTFLLAQQDKQGETPEIRLGRLDPRLRLRACGAEMKAFLPGGARSLGNTSVGVRCPGPAPWTVYVRATVRLFGEVLIADRHLSRGTIIAASDLRTERRDLGSLPGGYETLAERVIGKQVRRPLPVGRVISPRMLTTPLLVRRGERVVVVARQAGMEVSAEGIALGDAALGERLRVRNEASRRVIEGTVTAAQRMEVDL